jgi:hypothetical protein
MGTSRKMRRQNSSDYMTKALENINPGAAWNYALLNACRRVTTAMFPAKF